jgi:carotenoid 1,2-hydratase
MSSNIDSTLSSVNAARAAVAAPAPMFDLAMPSNGYAWWYIDAISDDGAHSMVIIAMLGSVFSPHYRQARTRGDADPLDHVALNVALYGRQGRQWAMTERPRASVRRTSDSLTIGPSSIAWDGRELTIAIDERTAPWGKALVGKVRVAPAALAAHEFAIDGAGLHWWQLLGAHCHVSVEFTAPDLRWQGRGYFDRNRGARPLEQDFASWTWARLATANRTIVLYDTVPRVGAPQSLALGAAVDGHCETIRVPASVALPSTGWGIARSVHADRDGDAKVIATLESAPFYARSEIATRLHGEAAHGIHESLSLDRFRARWVQALLPVRAPRAGP